MNPTRSFTFASLALAAIPALAADWISPAERLPEPTREQRHANVSVPGTAVFVKTVTNAKDVKSATWTVSGLGVFTCRLNGNEVGEEDFLKPGFTHVEKCRHAFAYDVTPFLNRAKDAKNVLSAEVSSGWWRDQIVGYRGKDSAFRAELAVTYADGTAETFGTDPSWLSAYAGPVRNASIFEGEDYDSRLGAAADSIFRLGAADGLKPSRVNDEFKGEIRPVPGAKVHLRRDLALRPVGGYVWKGVTGEAAGTNDATRVFGTVRILRKVRAGEAVRLEPGETLVVDFGQNCAAVPEIEAEGKSGATLVFQGGEMLNDGNGARKRGNDGPEGSVYRENMRGGRTTWNWTLAGRAEKRHPNYTFFGYRYGSLTATAPVTVKSIVSLPVSSVTAEDECGEMTVGDQSLNRFIQNTLWGMRSNYLSVPTDCPQRNERLGWAADTQVFAPTATRLADVHAFLGKWIDDMCDSQLADGSFPSVAPLAQYGNDGPNLGWADAGIIVPYVLWQRYGTTEVAARHWNSMKRFMERITSVAYGWDGDLYTYSDWLSFEKYETCVAWNRYKNDPEAVAYRDFLAKCHWRRDALMMMEMARAMGLEEDAKHFSTVADKAMWRLQTQYLEWYRKPLGCFEDMQGALLHYIDLGIVPERNGGVGPLVEKLVEVLRRNGDRLATGFLSTPLLAPVLTRHGHAELAWTLVLQHDYPSWLYSVDQGATTVWERWNSYNKERGFGPVGMNSFNHYAYGCMVEWLFADGAGIRNDPKKPGWVHFLLAPHPDRRVGFMKAKFRIPGTKDVIESEWSYDAKGKCTWKYVVPAGRTATVTLPDGTTKEVGAGAYVEKL